MEKLMNKTRILTWAVIALALFNVATIATVVWHFKQGKKIFHREHGEMMLPAAPMMGQMIKEKLKLTEIQIVKFDSIENAFKLKSENIFGKMKGVREEMVEEFTSESPDSVVLIKLTKELGDMHIGLKMNTFDFYFSMKKVCKPEQQKELSNIFRGMFMFDGMPGSGRVRGHRESIGRDRSGEMHEIEEDADNPGKDIPASEMGEKCKDKHKPNEHGAARLEHDKEFKKEIPQK